MADVADPNPIDKNVEGLIGKPVDRVDGPLKVCGKAPYAYEYQRDEIPQGQPITYGFILGSAIAKGSVLAFDLSQAKAAPGVIFIMTHENAPSQAPFGPPSHKEPLERPKPFLVDNQIRYYGEPVAFVVAESFEQARDAAALIKVQYAAETPKGSVARFRDEAYKPKKMNANVETDSTLGDFDKAFAEAPVKLDATYTTPYQHQQPMEPHACIAAWSEGKLTLFCAHQLPVSGMKSVAKTLKLADGDVRIICKYVGGGFGSKLPTQAEIILSALAARQIKRPVKIALTRQQEFFNVTHRPESIQRIRLGATADGSLTAIAHDCLLQTAMFDEFGEAAASCTRSLYAAPHRRTSHRLVKLDLPAAGSMRAPGEAIGLLALEQAMDEMAEKLGMDPVQFRLKNEPREDPERKVPFSTRALPACLMEGAKRFGWEKRNASPGQTREGTWLVGLGMAAAYRPNFLRPSEARVTLDGQGRLVAEMAMTDVGTGTYTILTQIAAETMQMPMEKVTVIIGDSQLPPTPGSGGSFGANSSGSGLFDACMALREKLAKEAVKDKRSPLYKLDAASAEYKGSKVCIGDASEFYQAIAARSENGITAEGKIGELKTYKEYSQAAYGGHFAEVAVDSATGEVRLRRMLGVFAAGRILNEKTARSQAIGGMIWGVSAALHEASIVDQRHGQFVNHDYAEYHVPVHADITEIEAVYLPEIDDKTGPLKIKGVGELGICGSGAAVANAIYNACGVRVRDYPVTLDKIIAGLA